MPELPSAITALNRLLSTTVDVAFQIFPLPGLLASRWLLYCYMGRGSANTSNAGVAAGTSNNTYDDKQVLVKTPARNYTAYDAAQLLVDLGFGHRVQALEAVQVCERRRGWAAPLLINSAVCRLART